MKYPQHFLKLVEALKRFPGVGKKSAERFAFQMIDWNNDHIQEFAAIIRQIPEQLTPCKECGCLADEGRCHFCAPERRDSSSMCIISSPRDAYAIEETREFKGSYHVLGSLLSPLDGRGPEHINIQKLKDRVEKLSIKELILALDATLEGDATALYLKKEFARSPVKISRLAFGLPMGSSFDYVDGGTLARALSGRGDF